MNQNIPSFYGNAVFKVTYLAYVDHPGFSAYHNRVKIGDATLHTTDNIQELLKTADPEMLKQGIITSEAIRKASRKRVKEWSGTADLPVKILLAGLNIKLSHDDNGCTLYTGFRDYAIHDVLLRSGFKKRFITEGKKSGEWFDISHEDAIEAYKATLNGHTNFKSLRAEEIAAIVYRPEQKEAAAKAFRHFKNATVENPKKFLWNAIMRFGKTLTAYKLVKEMYQRDQKLVEQDKLDKDKAFKRVLILTHRPVVGTGWKDDSIKSFGYSEQTDWQFSAKRKDLGVSWEEIDQDKPSIYFCSIQDLRGSFGLDANDDDNLETIYSKNKEVFDTEFSLVIIDEGHEGTQTQLAQKMMENIKAPYFLHLSGTPFNISDNFEPEEVYEWTYIDERKANDAWLAARQEWDEKGDEATVPYPGEINPYGGLPSIEIRTMNIEGILNEPEVKKYLKEGIGFDFNHFFAVDKSITKTAPDGTEYHPFVDEKMVARLLKAIFANDAYEDEQDRRMFPFADNRSKKYFADTLWMLPTVASAVALKVMLNNMAPEFTVVNATGDNDGGDALQAVQDAIKNNPYTITLSVGKLTAGTTVPQWTGVFMLSNMSSPMSYMQTIFRVKSAGFLRDGRPKEIGYVFDFAPQRTLTMVTESIEQSLKKVDENGKPIDLWDQDKNKRDAVNDQLKYLPIIAYDGVRFEKCDSYAIMKTMDKVFSTKAYNSGFSSHHLYAINSNIVLTEKDVEKFENLQKILNIAGYEKASKKQVNLASTELLSKEEKKALKDNQDGKDVDKRDLSEAERKLKKNKDNVRKMRDLLTGIAVRIPLIVFAFGFDERIDLDTFIDKIDDDSWNEFMPNGFTRDMWNDFKHFFNKNILEGACEILRSRVIAASKLPPLERAVQIMLIFATFHNPDKETILTPARVVAMQLAGTIGGLRFVNDKGYWYCNDGLVHSWEEIEDSEGELFVKPIWVDQKGVSNCLFNRSSSFYDINSKTALYPLYAACSVFYKEMMALQSSLGRDLSLDEQNELWLDIVEEQIFLNVRVPYSKRIAERVLLGYNTDRRLNCSVVDVVALRNVLKNIHAERVLDNSRVKIVDEDVSLPKLKKLSNDDINRVIAWVLLGVKNNGEDGFMTCEDRLRLLDKDIHQALAKVNEESFEDKFSAVLSNPPYQVSTDSTSNVGVWQNFVFISGLIGENISMVHPGRWVNPKATMVSIRDEIIKLGLVKLIYLTNNIFDNVDIDGGISITLIQPLTQSKDIDISVNNSDFEKWDINKKFFLNVTEESIYQKVETFLDLKIEDRLAIPLTSIGKVFFGIPKSSFDKVLFDNKDHLSNPVRVWANKGSGKGTRYGWYYIEKSLLSEVPESLLSTYKVMIDKVGHADAGKEKNNIFNNDPRVLHPDEISLGNQFYLIPENNTEEDCKLIASYMKTRFVRMLMNITQKDLYVRGLDNVPDYKFLVDDLHKDGLEEFTDEWLFKRFDISDEMIEYINLRISAK